MEVLQEGRKIVVRLDLLFKNLIVFMYIYILKFYNF